jgi:hypothetical protein
MGSKRRRWLNQSTHSRVANSTAAKLCQGPRRVSAIGGRGDRQHRADRLDPVGIAMIVDEGDHGLDRRSSSAIAK